MLRVKEARQEAEPEDNKIEITEQMVNVLNKADIIIENKNDKIQHFLKIGRKFGRKTKNNTPKIVPNIMVQGNFMATSM